MNIENTLKVRTFNKKVREMLKEVGIKKISYYNDFTSKSQTKRRRIFKFGEGGIHSHGVFQNLEIEKAQTILDVMNEVDGGWVMWNTLTQVDGKEVCKGFYKHEVKINDLWQ